MHVHTLENKREEGEEMPAGLLKSVFLLRAAGRQVGSEVGLCEYRVSGGEEER